MGFLEFLRRRNPRDDFARRLIERLRERDWPHRLTYDRKAFAIGLGGEHAVMNLGNIFHDWLAYPLEERDVALDEAVAFVFDGAPPETFDEAKEFLLPVVKNRTHVALTALRSAESALGSIGSEVLPPDGPLAVGIAIDQPHRMVILADDALSLWEAGRDEILAVALDNLRAKSPCSFERDDGGFYRSAFNDYYDASRLLLPDQFRRLELKGDPVAIAAIRHCLVVAGSEDTQALNAMAMYVEEGLQGQPRAISYAPHVLRDGRWRAFHPTAPELAAVRRLWVRQHVWDCAVQQAELEEHFGAVGRDIYVGSCEAIGPDDDVQTWTTWTHTVPTLLPRADFIAFTEVGGGSTLTRRWEDVETVCGPLTREDGHYPARFFVDEWPGAELLARLKRDFKAPDWMPD